MSAVYDFLKIIGGFFSFTGLCFALSRAFRIRSEFSPLLSSSCVIVLLTLSGILGILHIAFTALYVFGWAAFLIGAYSVLTKRAKLRKETLASIVFITFWAIYLILRLRSYVPYENDDMSHWALTARRLISTDSLPDASMTTIKFQAYPVGSAAFIYYLTRFSIHDEWMYAFAQGMLRAFCYLPLLSFIRKNRLFGYVTFFFTFMFITITNGFVTSLRVDSLLSVMGIGAIAVVYGHRDTPVKAAFLTIPIAASLVYIKYSGLFFSVLAAIASSFYIYKLQGRKRAAIYASSILFISLAFLAIWLLHVKCAFPAGFESKHAPSFSRYAQEASSKGAKNVLLILKAFLYALIHPKNGDIAIYILLIAAFFAIVITALLFKRAFIIRPLLKVLLVLTIVYILWLISLLFMYIFSMPLDEALSAASFPRYIRCITHFISGIAVIFSLNAFCHENFAVTNARRVWMLLYYIALSGMLVVFLKTDGRFSVVIDPSLDRTDRREYLTEIKTGVDIKPESRMLLLCAPNENENENTVTSLYYLVKYEFLTPDVTLIYRPQDNKSAVCTHRPGEPYEILDNPDAWFEENIPDYDCVIIYHPDEEIENLLFKHTSGAQIPLLKGESFPVR
ncbi:MAG: hypothetical protein IJC48_06795 [Clostridia bacterium]|nr:hypothetical protein [Clostridia bacterium]